MQHPKLTRLSTTYLYRKNFLNRKIKGLLRLLRPTRERERGKRRCHCHQVTPIWPEVQSFGMVLPRNELTHDSRQRSKKTLQLKLLRSIERKLNARRSLSMTIRMGSDV
jgi:hypothetical protein